MITVIDYGIGNVKSILNMLKRIGISDVRHSADINVINDSEKIILPGIGNFDYAINVLRSKNYYDLMKKKVLEEKCPVLGICLGAQLLTESSEESKVKGLGWIKANAVRFRTEDLPKGYKIPHIGWCDVTINKKSRLLDGISQTEAKFYFAHSFRINCMEVEDVLMSADYGRYFTAGYEKENILGVQFHPEKSHKLGMQLLHNFVKLY